MSRKRTNRKLCLSFSQNFQIDQAGTVCSRQNTRMKDYPKKLETVANVTIILFAVLFGAALVNRYFAPTSASRNSNTPQLELNSKFALDKVDWSSNKKNLVLAFSTSCGYCLASVDFYKQIAHLSKANGDMRLIVVSSQPKIEVKAFFDERELEIDEVIQTHLTELSINGTPTLVLVDSHGLVQKLLVGRLPLEREKEVLEALVSG